MHRISFSGIERIALGLALVLALSIAAIVASAECVMVVEAMDEVAEADIDAYCQETGLCNVAYIHDLDVAATPTKDATANANPVNAATEIHGLPGNNPAHGGSSASPNGNGVNGGNGIHNVAGGAPGQNADQGTPADGEEPPACDIHGGLENGYNPNCK